MDYLQLSDNNYKKIMNKYNALLAKEAAEEERQLAANLTRI